MTEINKPNEITITPGRPVRFVVDRFAFEQGVTFRSVGEYRSAAADAQRRQTAAARSQSTAAAAHATAATDRSTADSDAGRRPPSAADVRCCCIADVRDAFLPAGRSRTIADAVVPAAADDRPATAHDALRIVVAVVVFSVDEISTARVAVQPFFRFFSPVFRRTRCLRLAKRGVCVKITVRTPITNFEKDDIF